MNPYQYINSLSKFGSKGGFKPGLQRMEALLAPFGHPEKNLPVIHVAGSNGKGSTIAFIKQIYLETGLKVGVYTSPHLISFTERIEINGRQITEAELTEVVNVLIPVAEKLAEKKEVGKPSYFEFVTATALLFFSRLKPDIIILETGLGGRLDATNIIPTPLVSVITGISLEHTAILGNTTAKIAREKAGIIKNKRPVVTGVRDQEALAVISDIARSRNAPLKSIYDIYDYRLKETSLKGQRFTLLCQGVSAKESPLEEYTISLLGEHQIRNALLALLVVTTLKSVYPVTDTAIKQGLKQAHIPGRLEIVSHNPLILLDGAHNREGMEILVEYLKKEIEQHKKIYLIFGVLGDKDARGMIELLNFSNRLNLIITKNKEKRALEIEPIAQYAEEFGINYQIYSNLNEAINQTLKQVTAEDVLCITGSLYTVAEAKIILS